MVSRMMLMQRVIAETMWSDRRGRIAAVSVAADVPRRIRELIADNNMGSAIGCRQSESWRSPSGVSRPALREGLRRLIDLGALEPRQGSGTYVAGVDRVELLEVPDRLEPHAARQAAKNHTAIDAAAFTRILEDLREGVRGSYNELRLAIASASGNGVLAATVGMLVEPSPREVKITNSVVKDMTRVVDRIHERDGAGADRRCAGTSHAWRSRPTGPAVAAGVRLAGSARRRSPAGL